MALFLSDALSDEELKRLIQRAEKVRPLALEDLPLGELKRWMEQRFVTEAPNILLPRTVDTDQIADEAVTATQITAGTITANEIAAGTITATELSAGSVTTDKLAANAVTAEKIASHTITANEIAAGTITATEIEADTITADQIAAEAITTSELAANSVTSAKIAAGTIVSGDIAGGTITGGNIASGTITGANLVANTITTSELDANAIDGMTITGALIRTSASGSSGIRAYDTLDALVMDFDTLTGDLQIKGELLTGSVVPATTVTGQLTDSQLADIAAAKITGQITTTQITDDAITTPKVAAGAITTAEIAADTIVAGNIAAGAITATELDALAVTTAKIDAQAVTAAKIATGTITATQIAAGTITSNEIAANTIAAGNIAADAIGTSELAADSVTATEINVATLDAISVDAGTITAGTFRGTTFETASAHPKTRMDGTDGFFITDASGNVIVALSDDVSAPKVQIAPSTADVFGDNNSRIAWIDSGGHLGSWISGFDNGVSAITLGTYSSDGFNYESGLYFENDGSASTSTQLVAYIGDFSAPDHFVWVLRGDNMSSFVKDVWYASGTQLLNGGTTVGINGTEGYDSEGVGTGISYTAPRDGAYRIDGWVELQNPNADKRAIITWRKNGVDQGRPLACIFSNVAGNSVSAGGFVFATLAAGDVVTAVITNGDTAQRNIAWKLAVSPYGHIA